MSPEESTIWVILTIVMLSLYFRRLGFLRGVAVLFLILPVADTCLELFNMWEEQEPEKKEYLSALFCIVVIFYLLAGLDALLLFGGVTLLGVFLSAK